MTVNKHWNNEIYRICLIVEQVQSLTRTIEKKEEIFSFRKRSHSNEFKDPIQMNLITFVIFIALHQNFG